MNNKKYETCGWPINPSKYLLKRIYNGNVPPAENFITPHKARTELYRFLRPFRIDPREVEKAFGSNLDRPLDACFERQLNRFIEDVLEHETNPAIEGTKIVLRRMGRAGCLYRHGFHPKTPEELKTEIENSLRQKELEIENLRNVLKKRRLFERERDIKRKEAKKTFDRLNPNTQNRLLENYDHAKEDPSIIKRGGELEDFLILEFKLKISLFEKMAKTHKIEMSSRKITDDLKEIIYKRKKDEIDSVEFVRIYKACEIELYKLDSELKNM